MKKRVIWLVLSCLTALFLLLAACAPKPAAEVTPKEAVPKEAAPKEAAPKEVTAPEVKKAKSGGVLTMTDLKAQAAEMGAPRYGGTIIIGQRSADRMAQYWDQVYAGSGWPFPMGLIYDELLEGDWSFGPAGKGQFYDLDPIAAGGFSIQIGSVAESFEVPNPQTQLYHIRKGVYWQDKAPVNGREFTPADLVFNIKRMYQNPTVPLTYNVVSAQGGARLTDVYISPDDPWTVVVKTTDMAIAFLEDMGDKMYLYPPEVIEKYGDARDWRNAVGTGPFMLTDYVPGASITLTRNPNYWQKNPLGPGKGDQLPYADTILGLQILDVSTQVTALRTHKVDWLQGLEWVDVSSLLKTNPEINLVKTVGAAKGLTVKSTATDPLALPFLNKRVRQAVAMAVDNEAIVRDFYGGQAELFVAFWTPESPAFVPLKDMAEILKTKWGFIGKEWSYTADDPRVIEQMYGYHPEEAKKILAEAGYPNGFSTSMLLTSDTVDYYSMIAGYLKTNLNIDMKLDVRERTVYTGIWNAHAQPALLEQGFSHLNWPERWIAYGPPDLALPRNVSNRAEIVDPVIMDAIKRADAAWNAGDIALRTKVIQEVVPYIIQTAWYGTFPGPNTFTVYQPWLKNNYGTDAAGNRSGYNTFKYAWVDQELKKEITGKR